MKNFKITLFLSLLLSLSFWAVGQDLPQPSPAGSLEQKVGLTDISIEYSRPGVKNRTIFGDLVPFGEIWRTGANKATAINFSTDVMVNGSKVEAGTYSMFTIPGENEWTVILNENTELWGAGDYKQEEDAMRFMVKPQTCNFTETMTMDINDISDSSATINLMWEKTKISFPIAVDVKSSALKNIESAIKELNEGFRVYNSSARYYVNNDMDPKQALEWAQKSVSMDKKFWNVYTLSLAYAANGMYKEAISAAESSKALAVEADYAAYIKMNEKNIAEWSGK